MEVKIADKRRMDELRVEVGMKESLKTKFVRSRLNESGSQLLVFSFTTSSFSMSALAGTWLQHNPPFL